jgi:hypothetical protein
MNSKKSEVRSRKSEVGVFGFLLILLWIPSVSSLAQNIITFSGKVIDAQTREIIPLASISITNHSIGTIANGQGEFEFHVPDRYKNDTLRISAVGYKNYNSVVKDLKDHVFSTIPLTPRVYELKQVEVKAYALTATEIIQKVMKNISNNYSVTPFGLEGLFRMFRKEDGKFTSMMEAAVMIHDEGYPVNPKEIAKKDEEAYILETRHYAKDAGKKKHNLNPLYQILLNNDVRYFKNALDVGYDGVSIDYYNDRPVYVLTSKDPLYKVIVDAENFALLKVRLERHFGESKHFISKVNDSTQHRMEYFVKNLEFRSYEGRLYLQYTNYTFYSCDELTGSGRKVKSYEDRSELLVNNIIDHQPTLPESKKKLEKHKPMESHLGKYNEPFWKSYNGIAESSFDKKLFEGLVVDHLK